MAISVLIIAVVSYGLSLVDVCALVDRLASKGQPVSDRPADYYYLYRRYKWIGAGYALAADLLRALVTVLVGGLLMKGAGFPSIGKWLALMFALIGQAMPLLPAQRRLISKKELIYPALTLLFVDWRVFLAAVVLAVLVLALTGNRALMAAAGAVAMPIFTLIFRGWWLKIILALFCAIALIYCYWDEIMDVFTGKAVKDKKARTKKRPPQAEAKAPGEDE